MDYYFYSNEMRDGDTQIALQEFYNDGVNDEIELKSHYTKWLEAHAACNEHDEEFDKRKCFTLCSYPWILNTSSKREILNWENENT